MKVLLFSAISLNGKIARKDNSEDFLSDENWNEFMKYVRHAGTIVYGNTTYNLLKSWPKKYTAQLTGINIIVLSPEKINDKNVMWAKTPKQALILAKRAGTKELLVSGGSTVNKSFLKDKLVDEIILNLEPVIIGDGISMAAEEKFDAKFKFEKMKKNKKTIQLIYSRKR